MSQEKRIGIIRQIYQKIQRAYSGISKKQLKQCIINHPIITAVVSVSALGLLILYRAQEKMIYLPKVNCPQSPRDNYLGYRNPREQNLAYEDLQIKTEDNLMLKGWYIKAGVMIDQEDNDNGGDSIATQKSHSRDNQKAQRLVVYFHENAQNIGTRIDFIRQFVTMTNSDMILVAYRGYSDSQGQPSQSGLKKDANAIMEEALRRLNQNKRNKQSQKMPIYIFGRSLGGAVAIYSAAQNQFSNQITGVVLENTFTNIPNVASSILPRPIGPILKPIAWLLCRNYWNSINIIKHINCPIFFVKSAKDQLIPKSQMDQLQNEAKKHKKVTSEYLIAKGTHNNSWQINKEDYFDKLNQFFKNNQKKQSENQKLLSEKI